MRVETEAIALWKKLSEREGEVKGGGGRFCILGENWKSIFTMSQATTFQKLTPYFFRYAYVRVDNFKQWC